MAYLDAILNSELLSYIVATILITIAVWLFSGLYSCATCSKKEHGEEDGVKTMTTKSWFKLLLGIACVACSGLLVYRNVMSTPPPTSASPPPIGYVRGAPIAQIGGNDSDSEDSNFN